MGDCRHPSPYLRRALSEEVLEDIQPSPEHPRLFRCRKCGNVPSPRPSPPTFLTSPALNKTGPTTSPNSCESSPSLSATYVCCSACRHKSVVLSSSLNSLDQEVVDGVSNTTRRHASPSPSPQKKTRRKSDVTFTTRRESDLTYATFSPLHSRASSLISNSSEGYRSSVSALLPIEVRTLFNVATTKCAKVNDAAAVMEAATKRLKGLFSQTALPSSFMQPAHFDFSEPPQLSTLRWPSSPSPPAAPSLTKVGMCSFNLNSTLASLDRSDCAVDQQDLREVEREAVCSVLSSIFCIFLGCCSVSCHTCSCGDHASSLLPIAATINCANCVALASEVSVSMSEDIVSCMSSPDVIDAIVADVHLVFLFVSACLRPNSDYDCQMQRWWKDSKGGFCTNGLPFICGPRSTAQPFLFRRIVVMLLGEESATEAIVKCMEQTRFMHLLVDDILDGSTADFLATLLTSFNSCLTVALHSGVIDRLVGAACVIPCEDAPVESYPAFIDSIDSAVQILSAVIDAGNAIDEDSGELFETALVDIHDPVCREAVRSDMLLRSICFDIMHYAFASTSCSLLLDQHPLLSGDAKLANALVLTRMRDASVPPVASRIELFNFLMRPERHRLPRRKLFWTTHGCAALMQSVARSVDSLESVTGLLQEYHGSSLFIKPSHMFISTVFMMRQIFRYGIVGPSEAPLTCIITGAGFLDSFFHVSNRSSSILHRCVTDLVTLIISHGSFSSRKSLLNALLHRCVDALLSAGHLECHGHLMEIMRAVESRRQSGCVAAISAIHDLDQRLQQGGGPSYAQVSQRLLIQEQMNVLPTLSLLSVSPLLSMPFSLTRNSRAVSRE